MRPRRALTPSAEAGGTLIEFLVAIALVGVLMTALTAFFVTTVSATSQQRGAQAAIQLADDGVERVRALRGSAVTAGRDKVSSDTQWGNPVARVAPYLVDMREAWDPTATFPAGAIAPLPTTASSITVNSVAYRQNWYVGTCWQPAAGGDCVAIQTAGSIGFYRVVVAVTWPDRHCPAATCSHVTSTLLSSAASEPVFTSGVAAPPTVTGPGNQVGELTVVVSLQLVASAGTAPLTWSASGLPPTLSISPSGLITGTPTILGAYPVTVRVTDGAGLTGTAAFTWTINALPVLTSPGNQNTAIGRPVALPIVVTGGTGPMLWSVTAPGPWGATGLPPGLSINPATGVITGTPTTRGPARNVTVNVTDAFGKPASTTFRWVVP